ELHCPLLPRPVNGDVIWLYSGFQHWMAIYECSAGYQLNGSHQRFCTLNGTWDGSAPTCETPTDGTMNGDSVLTFTCNTGYNLVGPSTLTCQLDLTWDGNPPTCEAAQMQQCPILTEPTNGTMSGENVLTFTCNTGYNLVGPSTLTCLEDGTWDGSPPTCEAVQLQCPTLTPPLNGYLDLYGTSFRCHAGYNLVGPSTLTCLENGTWDGNPPTCEVVQCPVLTAPENGGKTGGNSYQDVVTFTCDPGYVLDGSSSLTCGADATWIELDCPYPLSSLSNGSIMYVYTSLDYSNYIGWVAVYSCDPGYTLNGNFSRFCGYELPGIWNGSAPTCQAVQECPILTAPTNGTMSGENVLTFTCNTGYNLVGPSTLTCQLDGTWDGSPPTCEVGQCPILTAPANGAVSGSNNYGDEITFTCYTGYNLVGSSTLTCQSDLTWSRSAPTCSIVQCPVLAAPENGGKTGGNSYQDRVTFTCDPGYVLDGSSSLTCGADATWSGVVPICIPFDLDCPYPLSSPSNGSIMYVYTSLDYPAYFGLVAFYSCDPGYTLKGNFSRFCGYELPGIWNGSAPTCQSVPCPALTAPTNGDVSGDMVLTFTCNTGYNLVGSSTLTCQEDLTWDGSPPTCEVVQCPVLAAPENGGKTGGNSYQDVVTFTCDPGYVLDGSSSLTCGADATWSGIVPTCTLGQCPTMTPPANGAVSGSNNYGDEITFACNTGYNLVGSSTLTCQSDLTWSRNPPTCSIVQCPVLAAPENGGKTGGNSYQDRVTFTCDPGYVLDGSSSLTCGADATWSGNVPTCTRVQCPALQPPTNGDSSGDNYYQEVMSFTCNPGYEPDGSASLTCQADGTWSGSVPSCTRAQCPQLITPNNGRKTGDNYYQDVVTFLCDPGYELVGPTSLTCQADRTWSGNVPTCTRVQCPVSSSPINGISSGSNFYQDVVQFTCDQGYDLVGESISTCQADRTWSSNIPSCNDIDECSAVNGGCDHVCTNTIGSFQCSCVDGFELSVDSRTCNDVDECGIENAGCHQNCNNIFGSYWCSCGAGYRLNNDGHTCSDVDECLAANGGCAQTCTNTIDVEECYIGNGGCEQTCTNFIGSFQCSCQNGYSLNNDGFTCDDIDECASGNGGCAQTCTNGIGSFQCSCGTGYGLNADSVTCDASCAILGGRGQSSSGPLESDWNVAAFYDKPYMLASRHSTEFDVDECASANGGCDQTCTNNIGIFQCSCSNGYTLNSNSFACDDLNECATANGGCDQNCINSIGSFECSCEMGYNLHGDGFSCDDINECNTANGDCGQMCNNTVGSFQCTCGIGYALNADEFTCDDIDECDTENGGCAQICNNTVGSFECFCRTGYILNVNGLVCDDVDECGTANGGCGQFCTNTIGSFNCFCATGYNLSMDGIACDGFDPVSHLSCSSTTTTSISVSWTKPVARIMGYSILYIPMSGLYQHSLMTSFWTRNDTNVEISGLYSGVEYSFTVLAFGLWNDSANATVNCITGLPPPTNVTISRLTESSASVQWSKPAGALVVAYRVWVTDKETTLTVSKQYLTDSATSAAFLSLTPATEYVVTVACISLSIEGPQASLTIVTDTDPPRQLLLSDIRYNSLTLSWIPPAAKLLEYELTYSSTERHRLRRSLSSIALSGNVGNYRIQGLVPATHYAISLTAVSRFGRSSTINSTAVTATDPPSELEVIDVSSTWLNMAWTPPVAAVVSYALTVTDVTTQEKKHFSIPPAATDFNITGLFPSTKYIIRIAAVSMYGRSVEAVSLGTTGHKIGGIGQDSNLALSSLGRRRYRYATRPHKSELMSQID
ncbi:hypothetical protein Bbelb_373740, partial [Branchiostoma belcheri]